ncbi:MAG: acyltransferase [Cytophagaceae bacterium]
MRLDEIKSLNGIRGFAVLMVFFFHFIQEGFLPNIGWYSYLIKFAFIGQTGVTLFFILSGFLITRILLNTPKNNLYFYNFYIKRILRIFPLYFSFLILYYYVFSYFKILPESNFIEQLPYWCNYQNIALTFKWRNFGPNHYWSLAVEEHFYLIWPLLTYLVNLKDIKKVAIILIIFSVLVRIFMVLNGYSTFYFTITRMDSILVGAIIATLDFNLTLNKILKSKSIYILFLISFIIIVYLYITLGSNGNSLILCVKDLFYNFSYGLLIAYLVVNRDSFVSYVFERDWICYLGKISYGIYIFHPIILLIIRKYFDFNLGVNLSLTLVVTIILSSFSFNYFEKFFLDKKSILLKKI